MWKKNVTQEGENGKLSLHYERSAKGGGGGVALSAKCLPCRPEDLSSILRTHTKEPGVEICGCNPSTTEAEKGGSLELASR